MNIGGYDFRSPIVRREDSVVMVAITSEGKREAEAYTNTGPKFAVLSSLNENSPQSIHSLARETHIEVNKVRAILKEFKQKEYIRVIKDKQPMETYPHEVQG